MDSLFLLKFFLELQQNTGQRVKSRCQNDPTVQKKSRLKVRPLFPGCGILNSAEGDIFYSGTLVEIKAGQRNFSILDIRQLYISLALNQFYNRYNILFIELFNPRTGLLWRENKEIVSQNISGNSTIEIITEIINHVTSETNST